MEDAAEEFSDAVEEAIDVLLARALLDPIPIHLSHGLLDHGFGVRILRRDWVPVRCVDSLGLIEVCVLLTRHLCVCCGARKHPPLCGAQHTLAGENVDDLVVDDLHKLLDGGVHRHARLQDANRQVNNALDAVLGLDTAFEAPCKGADGRRDKGLQFCFRSLRHNGIKASLNASVNLLHPLLSFRRVIAGNGIVNSRLAKISRCRLACRARRKINLCVDRGIPLVSLGLICLQLLRRHLLIAKRLSKELRFQRIKLVGCG